MDLSRIQLDWQRYDGALKSFEKYQIIEIMNDYYNSNLSVATIYSKYSIDEGILSLSKEFPKAVLKEKCPYDGSNLVRQLRSRTGHAQRIPQCPVCGHRLADNCDCENCQQKREQFIKEKRQAIVDAYSTDVDKVGYDNLSATAKIFLSALLHAGLNERATKISGPKIAESKLSPTSEFDKNIVKRLSEENAILVDPDSPIEAFSADEFPKYYYIYDVNYLINIDTDSIEISDLEYPDRDEIIKHKEECLELWKQLALYECLEYLVGQMKKAKFEFNPQEKTKLVINHLIEEYSIGQIRNLIYGSVNNAAAWYQKSNVSRNHAANSVITTLNNRGDKAKVENWHLKPYQRSYGTKTSQLSMVLFDGILQLGNRGYEEVPSIDLIV